MNKSDRFHKDMSLALLEQKRKEYMEQTNDMLLVDMLMSKYHVEPGYRQYFLCKACMEVEESICNTQNQH
jgi:hypothetical protein